MKRIIASLLAGLCLLALVGCSAGSKADSATPKDYSQIIHDARTDEDNEYDMIFTKGEDGKFTAIDGYSAEYEADQLNDELKDIVFPLLGLEDGSYESFAASVSSMMVRSYAVAIVKPAEGKTDAVKAALEAYVHRSPHWRGDPGVRRGSRHHSFQHRKSPCRIIFALPKPHPAGMRFLFVRRYAILAL